MMKLDCPKLTPAVRGDDSMNIHLLGIKIATRKNVAACKNNFF